MQIFFLHPGKAAYPEIAAYKEYFGGRAYMLDGTLDEYNSIKNKSEYLVWCIMGFYPRSLKAKYVIHDYRSLSIGKHAKIKDLIKRLAMPKPNLRIYQNHMIESAMKFSDRVPSIHLQMGVPKWIYDIKPDSSLPKATFCYIGEITKDRGMDLVINAFIKSRRETDSLILVGNVEQKIHKEFKKAPGVTFTGKMTQKQALIIVKNSEYCICRIPKKYPYDYQMPTKFIEYAAEGKIIICNDSPSNNLAIQTLRYPAIISDDAIFSASLFEKIETWKCDQTAYTGLDWHAVIDNSNINSYIAKVIEER